MFNKIKVYFKNIQDERQFYIDGMKHQMVLLELILAELKRLNAVSTTQLKDK